MIDKTTQELVQKLLHMTRTDVLVWEFDHAGFYTAWAFSRRSGCGAVSVEACLLKSSEPLMATRNAWNVGKVIFSFLS
jgi:hypothetical protein